MSDIDRDPDCPPVWLDRQGKALSCREKVKVLRENWIELRERLQDALDDAVLMGCDSEGFKSEFHRLIDSLRSEYERPDDAPER